MKGAQGILAKELTGPAEQAGATAGKKAGSSFGKNLAKFGAVAAGGVAAAGFGLFKVGKIFDEVNDTIRVGTGATGKTLDGLVATAKNVGRQVPAEFSQIGTVVADLNTRLGLTGPTLETLSKQFLEAGRILGEEIDVQSVTGAFSAFRIEGEDTTAAMDTLFQVSQATGVGVNDLGSRLAKQGGILAQLGFSFEDTAALMGVLNKSGVDANAVFASMQAGLVRLAADGEQPADAFKRVTGEIQGFIDSGDDAAALDLAGKAFGTRGAGQMISALKSGKLNLDDMAAAAGLSGDSILEVGEDTADLGEKWQVFKNRALLAIEPVATRVFNALGDGMDWLNRVGVPAFQKFAEAASVRLRPAMEAIGNFITTTLWPALQTVGRFITGTVVPGFASLAGWLKENQAWLMPIAVGVLAAAAAYKIWTTATAVWTAITKGATAAQKALNLAMKANPIGIVIALLVGLAAGLKYAWDHSETFRNVVTGVWNAIRTAATTAWNWIKTNVIDRFVAALTWLWNSAVAVKDGVVGAFRSLRDGVSSAYVWLRDNVLSPVITWFQKVWDKAKAIAEGIGAAFTTVKDTIAAAFGAIWEAVKKPINVVIGGINDFIIDPINTVTGVFGIDAIGHLDKLHSGGFVPGSGEKPYMLLGGEAVLNPSATKALGPDAINALNRGQGFGGPADWLGDRWDDIKNVAGAIADQVSGWLKQGAAFALGKVIDVGTAGVRGLPGNSFAEDWMVGGFRHFKDAIVDWGKGQDSETSDGGKSFGSIGKNGMSFPLPPGSFRVGVPINGYPGHTGQDFPAPVGTPVYAPFAGQFSGVNLGNRSYGRYATVAAAGLRFIGAHLSALVGGNRLVQAGEMIGRVGSTGNSTGPHLHAEFRQGGVVQNPRKFLRFDSGGMLAPGAVGINQTARPEPVFTASQWDALEPALTEMARGGGGTTFVIQSTTEEQLQKIRMHDRLEQLERQRVVA